MAARLMFPLLVGLTAGAPALAQQRPAPPTAQMPDDRVVSVSGTGTVKATPDQATINLGVESQARSASEALANNSRKMTALVETLKQGGVLAKDIQTSQVNIHPVYAGRDEGTEPRLTGYRATNMLTVTVRSVDNLGSMLDKVVKAGGNQVHGIEFGFSDPELLMDRARAEAMKEARRRAEQLARLAGATLGPALLIDAAEPGLPPPVPQARAMAMEAAPATPVEPGEAEVQATVNVTYALRGS